MNKSPRLLQIEAMLADDPDDAFLRYGQAMEYMSAKDDATAVKLLHDLIAVSEPTPYIPAFLQAGQAYARMGEEESAAEVLKAGIAAAKRDGSPEAMHALSEMQGLLATVE